MRRPHCFPRRGMMAFGGIFVLVGTLALAACGTAGTSTGNTSGTSGTSNTSAQSIVSKVEQNQLKTVHLTTTERVDTSNGPLTTTSTGDVVLQPTYAAQLNTTVQNGSQQTAASEIIANNTVYVKQGNSASWQQVPLPNNTLNTLPIISLQNLGALRNLQYVGTGQLNGHKVYQLQGVGTQTVGSATFNYTENVWVGASNYYPEKMTVTSVTPAGNLLATTTFSQWNQPVTITVPNGTSAVTAG